MSGDRDPKGRFAEGGPGGPGRPKGSGRVQVCEEWADRQDQSNPGGFQILFTAIEKGYRRVIDPSTNQQRWVPVDDATWRDCLKLAIAYGKGKPITPFGITADDDARNIATLLAGLGSPEHGQPGPGGAVPAESVGEPGVVSPGSGGDRPMGDGSGSH